MTRLALTEAPRVWLCEECGQRCDEPLIAPNPFAPEEDLHACPHCRVPECLTPHHHKINQTEVANGR